MALPISNMSKISSWLTKLPRYNEPRKWGESRPGEVYIAAEMPGNPSWESRNPKQPIQSVRTRSDAMSKLLSTVVY